MYIDEIENSSYTSRVFYMGRRSKISIQQKLSIINEAKTVSAERLSKKFNVDAHTIRRWQRIFQYQEIDGLENTCHNKNYSVEFKRQLVVEFDRQSKNEVWVTDTTEVLYGIN